MLLPLRRLKVDHARTSIPLSSTLSRAALILAAPIEYRYRHLEQISERKNIRSMGLFGKKLTTCPICNAGIPSGESRSHWSTHVRQIPAGEGDASGQYTWDCKCGPSGRKWQHEGQANSGLAVHMYERHNIEISA
jgi:hypothetical protein